ncbi:SET domain-containing protein [Candidatus Kaiserbacteria bacterium]|nr:SET domain-containing protein [Candidatus Kaiserbacteria bacterium]
MKTETNGFSFILKPSTIVEAGIGVFALHDIAKGTHMALFLKDFEEMMYKPEDVPEELQGYCLDLPDGKLQCPKYFNRMDIGNYLNHSENANIRWEGEKGYFAARDIRKGEEILADYRQLGEPEDTWAEYYR